MSWTIYQGMKTEPDNFSSAMEQELDISTLSTKMALFWLVFGLILLVVSSRMLVWGAVEIAQDFGISDIIIGLTIVAIGTSLPELASSILEIGRASCRERV